MRNEVLGVLGTSDEMGELIDVLVRECGCGCAYDDGELVRPTPRCAAAQALQDRRFFLGMLFARRLRPQLVAEEWTR